jgi:hypothetical protein
MVKNKRLHFETYEEAGEWFESADMTEYEDRLTPVEFSFDLRKSRDFVELDHEVAVSLRQLARKQKIPSRRLVNKWLREKINSVA